MGFIDHMEKQLKNEETMSGKTSHKITIIIETDNAAFEEDETLEAKNILIKTADKLPLYSTSKGLTGVQHKIQDINGNICGSITIEKM
jgi:hypothetical protein